jgi:hypothetical protein
MLSPKLLSRTFLLSGMVLLSASARAHEHGKAHADKALAPGSVQVHITPEMARTAIKSAFGSWSGTNVEQLKTELGQIEHSGKVSDGAGLRGIRKPAKALRSMMSWLDANHDGKAVKKLAFAKFVTKLGHLDDAITAGVDAEVKEQASEALKELKASDLSADLAKFEPTSPESFRHYMVKELGGVEKLMAKPQMTATEFHDIRKVMRGLYFSVHYSGADEQSPAVGAFGKLLSKIGSDMGDVHGEQAIEELKGKIKNLDTEMMTMPDATRADIQTLIASLAKN